MKLKKDWESNIALLKEHLSTETNFDVFTKKMSFGDRSACLVGINGLCDTDLLLDVLADLEAHSSQSDDIESLYAQCSATDDLTLIAEAVLSGQTVLLIEQKDKACLLDTRSYPARGIQEPDMERVSRGARDGFTEVLLQNTALIRRRIRSTDLTFELKKIGTVSATDVVIAYMNTYADETLLQRIREQLEQIKAASLTMGSVSLEELLIPGSFLHPLPSLRTTERPDVVCSHLVEGHIAILVDTSPIVLLLPGTLFQFTQSPDDYYRSPPVGGFFRLLRFLCIPVNLLLLPVFLLLTAYYPDFSEKWQLLSTDSMAPARIFFYVLAVDFAMDLLKYSAALTSSKYSGSLSIVGGLLIGDIAVKLNWASVEVLFYAGISLLAGISLANVEFADGLRLYRLFLILTTGFFGPKGFWIGLLLTLISTATTPTIKGYSYLWPLIPFDRRALHNILFRNPTPKAQPPHIRRK